MPDRLAESEALDEVGPSRFEELLAQRGKLDEARIVASLTDDSSLAQKRSKHANTTPLFVACKHPFASLGLIETIYGHYPGAIDIVDKRGNSPLHAACLAGQSAEVVNFILGKKPCLLRLRNCHRATPFELAIRGSKSVELVRHMAKLYPEGLDQKTRRGQTALHLACSIVNVNPQIVHFLMTQRPDALSLPVDGMLPIHLLLSRYRSHFPAQVLRHMIETCPAALSAFAPREGSPLHIACWKKAPIEIVRMIYEKNPGALQENIRKDTNFRSPLHLAMIQQSGPAVIEFLAENYASEAFTGTDTPSHPEVLVAFWRGLRKNPRVKSVNFNMQNARVRPDSIIKTLEGAQSANFVEFLDLAGKCDCQGEKVEDVDRALKEMLERNEGIKHLVLQGNSMPSAWVEALEHNETLEVLNIQGCRMGPELSERMAQALRRNRKLRKLKFGDNSLSETGKVMLLMALKENCSVQEIDVYPENLSLELLGILGDILKDSNCTLQKIEGRNLAHDELDEDDEDDEIESERTFSQSVRTVRYYCRLNSAGRRKARDPNLTKEQFYRLVHQSRLDLNLVHGLLRENPHVWLY